MRPLAAVYYYSSTAMRVCIDKMSGAQVSGRVFYSQLESPIIFKDLGSLLIQIEDVLDQQGYPHAFQKKRSFLRDSRVDTVNFHDKLKRHQPIQQHHVIDDAFGEECTLLVYILSRRNSSWQGKIEWLADGSSETFTSALDFLRRVDVHLMRKEELAERDELSKTDSL